MKLYSFLQEATIKDYFVKTFGTFRFLFSGKTYAEVALKANLKGFKPIHLSKTTFGDPSSAYFIDQTGQKLLRVSDHWSESNIQNVFTCGNIKQCYWRLLGRQGSSSKGKIQAGIIDLSKLQDPNTIKNPNHNISTIRNYFGDTLKSTTNRVSTSKPKISEKDRVLKLAKRDKEIALLKQTIHKKN